MKTLKITSSIARCEACSHWFCSSVGIYPKIECSFCGKTEEFKYHKNSKPSYESLGVIVKNRWRFFNIRELWKIPKIELLLCSDSCMCKLLRKIEKNFDVELQLYGTYWKDEEYKIFRNLK